VPAFSICWRRWEIDSQVVLAAAFRGIGTASLTRPKRLVQGYPQTL
jgi:hypothetical protein